MSTVRGEDVVVLAPHDQRRRLIFTEVRLPGRVPAGVAPVVVEQRQHDLLVAMSVQEAPVHVPPVWAEALGIARPVHVLPLGGVDLQQSSQHITLLGRTVSLVCLDGISELAQPFHVSVAVLYDERFDFLRMPNCEAEAHRRAVVHHVEAIAVELQLIGECLDDVRQAIKRVGGPARARVC